MKNKIFLDGPRAPRPTIKKKRWGSGDENDLTPTKNEHAQKSPNTLFETSRDNSSKTSFKTLQNNFENWILPPSNFSATFLTKKGNVPIKVCLFLTDLESGIGWGVITGTRYRFLLIVRLI